MKSAKILFVITGIICSFLWNVGLGQWQTNGNHIYNTNSGFVGIGNSSPATLLYVAKNMTEPNITVRNMGGTGGATYTMTDDASGANWKFKATLYGGFKIRDHAHGYDVITIEPNSMSNVLYINDYGNVGLGMTSPYEKLVVNGRIKIDELSNYSFLFLNNHLTDGNAGIAMTTDDNYRAYMFYDEDNEALRIGANNNYWADTMFFMTNNREIGINTNVPNAKLEVRYNNYSYCQLGVASSIPHYFYHYELSSQGDGQASMEAYRTRDEYDANNGTDYGIHHTNMAIKGSNYWGDLYSFGISGFNYNDYTRCGGILGAEWNGVYWGSLGYRNSSGTEYGGYFSSYTTGSGKSDEVSVGIGMGAWGDLFGADIHGKIYGLYAEGDNFALYSHGVTYKDNVDVHLQENGTEERTVLYTSTSTDVTVQTSGKAVLNGGRASIAFDPAFTRSLASEESLVITVTPVGESNGVHLMEITPTGFSVVENNGGKSNATVNFIAVGKRAGFDKPALDSEVVAADYTAKLSGGLHADSDTKSEGEGLYYKNGRLIVGKLPSVVPDPDKPKEIARYPHVESSSVPVKDNYSGVPDIKK